MQSSVANASARPGATGFGTRRNRGTGGAVGAGRRDRLSECLPRMLVPPRRGDSAPEQHPLPRPSGRLRGRRLRPGEASGPGLTSGGRRGPAVTPDMLLPEDFKPSQQPPRPRPRPAPATGGGPLLIGRAPRRRAPIGRGAPAPLLRSPPPPF